MLKISIQQLERILTEKSSKAKVNLYTSWEIILSLQVLLCKTPAAK